MEIQKDGSPELAIKIAYDFGRSLRSNGADASRFPELLTEHVAQPYADQQLLPYIIAGFTAGFHFQSLPWRREIEAKLARPVAT